MCEFDMIEKEINDIKYYIDNIVISNYKNCILFEKLEIISNLYFIYINISDYINEIIGENPEKTVLDNIMNVTDDIRFKVMVLKTQLSNIEQNHKKTDESILFKEYINKNQEIIELFIEKKGLRSNNFETLIMQ